MVAPVPKSHTSHMGHQSPTYNILSNYIPGEEGEYEWWEYLNYDSEEDYKAQMRYLQDVQARERANIDVYYTDDESSEYFGYTYDEIISMYEEGADIPVEVMNWAKSMAQNDIAPENDPIQADDAEALYESLKQNPDVNLRTITEIFSKKCKEKGQELDIYTEELASYLKDVDVMKNKVELLKKDAEKEATPLKDEWERINYKLKNNIELTPKEKERAYYIKDKLGEIDTEYRSQISSEIANINIYTDKINLVSQKIEIANSFSRVSKTILDELASPESSTANAGIMTNSDLQTEETFSNENVNANFTDTLFDAVYAMDNSASYANDTSVTMMSTLEEMSEIGGFQLNDPNHTITISFSEDMDFSILEEEENKSNDKGGNTGEPDPIKGNNPIDSDINPDEIPPEEIEDGVEEEPLTGTGNGNNTPQTQTPTNNYTPHSSGGRTYHLITNADDPNSPFKPKTNKSKKNKNSAEEKQKEEGESMLSLVTNSTEQGKSGIGGVKSQTSDTKSQTAGTLKDATTSGSHKKDSIAKQKIVEKELKNLVKDKKKYDKNLKNIEKQVNNQQKKVEESDNRVQEQMAKAETMQESAKEDNGVNVGDEIASIAQDIAGIAAETKAQSENLNKGIKTQKNLRKESVKSTQKLEKSFENMASIGKDYQKSNDKTQNTANIVSKVSSTVTFIGNETKSLGIELQGTGKAASILGKMLQGGLFTAALGAILDAAGIVADKAVGKTMQTVGTYAEITGTVGSLAAGATTLIATDARKAEDSFVDTSKDAQSEGKNIRKDTNATDKNIKTLNKDAATVKKKAAEFQAKSMQVATMDGAGNLSQMSGGGAGGIGGTVGAGGTGGAGGLISEAAGGIANRTDDRRTSVTGSENGTTIPGTPNETNTNEPENTIVAENPEGNNLLPNEEEPENGQPTNMPDFEDMTVEISLDDETDPALAYNPDGYKGHNKPDSNNSPSEKPYIKAPEEIFNQSSGKRKKR